MNSYKISKLLIAHLYTTFLLSTVERAVGYSLVKNTKQAYRREKCTVNKSYELINSKPIISLFLGVLNLCPVLFLYRLCQPRITEQHFNCLILTGL